MLEIDELRSQFENKTLPKEEWTHNAHFAVAFVYIDNYKTIEKSLSKIRESIKDYNVSVGTENNENSGYHETLTIFWLTVVFEYCALKDRRNTNATYLEFIQTSFANPKFPLHFYSKELLFSISARQKWMEPDLLPISKIKESIMVLEEDKYDFYCEEALSGKTKIDILFESKDVLAFYHTRPFWEKHIVIIPKKHIKDLISVSDEDMKIITQIMHVARDLAKDLDLSEGVKLLTNLGKFQDTPHIHFHLAQGKEIR
jgi:histidine triad (HIT) family protein